MKKLLLSSLAVLLLLPLVASCRGEAEPQWRNEAFDYVTEGRGTWMGRSRGVDWDSTMAALAGAGFNMVFPCMNTGGSALYPSGVLPMTSERDELALCIEAAHKHGIEVHVWRINWYMAGAPDSFARAMLEQDRIQYSWDGRRNGPVMKSLGYSQPEDWLCPSHPENRELEKEAMLELVRDYDVDGVHFDYMRYSNDHLCYCDGCRERFQEETGLELPNWPDEVWKEGKYRDVYLDWRRKLIHSSAREISRAVHTLDPGVIVSLAARCGVEWAYYSDAQEWWAWIQEGILDIVCPMNYTADPGDFRTRMQSHLPLVRSAAPYYSGLGVYEMDTFEPLARNIEIGRELGQDGFVTFEVRRLRKYLGQLAEKYTAEPALLPHRAPEAHFIMPATGRETSEGFPVLGAGGDNNICRASLMMSGKLDAGIERLRGEAVIVDMEGNIVSRLAEFDQRESTVLELPLDVSQPGRYRVGLYGMMKLSTGESRPFIVKSQPFEV